jgi:hypothetical protein
VANPLALGTAERLRNLGNASRGATRQAGDVCKIAGQGFGRAHRRRSFALRFEASEEKQRVGEQPFPDLTPSGVEGGTKPGDLATGESVLGCGTSQAKTAFPVAPYQWNQILHRRTGRNLPGAHETLDLLRKLVHESQVARDPAGVATQAPRHLSR